MDSDNEIHNEMKVLSHIVKLLENVPCTIMEVHPRVLQFGIQEHPCSSNYFKGEFVTAKVERYKEMIRNNQGIEGMPPLKGVIIKGTFVVLDGHHRARAIGAVAKNLKITSVPVEIYDYDKVAEVFKRYEIDNVDQFFINAVNRAKATFPDRIRYPSFVMDFLNNFNES